MKTTLLRSPIRASAERNVCFHRYKLTCAFFSPCRNVAKENELIKHCEELLWLKSLTKDETVSFQQILSCCEALIQQPLEELTSTRVIVSKYYQVSDDGQITIPWDWKWRDVFNIILTSTRVIQYLNTTKYLMTDRSLYHGTGNEGMCLILYWLVPGS
jgi:hypothetical protein